MILSRNSSEADSYYQLVRDGKVFAALATVTAPVAYGTAAGIGGPLLWNNTGPGAAGSKRVLAVLLGLSIGWTNAPAATGALGVTVGKGQTSAPTTTTAIDGIGNLRPDGPSTPLCNLYRIGTIANAGTTIHITHSISTAATPSVPVWVPLDGLVVVPPGCWASVAGAAAIATLVAQISLVFAEVPF